MKMCHLDRARAGSVAFGGRDDLLCIDTDHRHRRRRSVLPFLLLLFSEVDLNTRKSGSIKRGAHAAYEYARCCARAIAQKREDRDAGRTSRPHDKYYLYVMRFVCRSRNRRRYAAGGDYNIIIIISSRCLSSGRPITFRTVIFFFECFDPRLQSTCNFDAASASVEFIRSQVGG